MKNDFQHKPPTERIRSLRQKTLSAERFLSIEQAKIITRIYKESEGLPVPMKRAKALSAALLEIPIAIDPEELIVGNRTPDARAGVVFPEAGVSWLAEELCSLPFRKQDPFSIRQSDSEYFVDNILPFWKGRTLEDRIKSSYGTEISAIEKVVKINQKDHAQGHICPDVASWLSYGPAGMLKMLRLGIEHSAVENLVFYQSAEIVLESAIVFLNRYANLASEMAQAESDPALKDNLIRIHHICSDLSKRPAARFHEAVQSVWFLFVILHMESNASSFSPGRMDQYLYPFYMSDLNSGSSDKPDPLEILDALFIKFNQIVYMRNEHSAKYFAGFPIGFNVTIGGKKPDGSDATNDLSYLFLKAHDHIRLPQPNLTARLHKHSPDALIDLCAVIIGLGTGMPQIVSDESIIPSLLKAGLSEEDAINYALVGCVEISSTGNYLGWSDSAMFNLVKVLELTLNNGICQLTGRNTGLRTGSLKDYKTYEDLEKAFSVQIDHFINRMVRACEVVEEAHQQHLPSPFLSCVIRDCIEKGTDVTTGGAKYNFSGIQAIQVANVADSLAVLKQLVFDEKKISGKILMEALVNDFNDNEYLRQWCINHVPKYGNDVSWVDEIGAKWIEYFATKLREHKNYRGGEFHTGLYTVSAHIPMGENVGATPDGRHSGDTLADGGLSPMHGRDKHGPTAILKSVARIPSDLAPNGTLLNMKFLPSLFSSEYDLKKFSFFIKSFVKLQIHHVQFNVVTSDDLIKAKKNPQEYRGLTIRVAGYTAFFSELSEELQDEIISRTTQAEDV